MAVDKKVNYDVQGGVKNYLGKQKQVKAPLKWQSSPDHPTTELAYITEAEKDLLVKSDLHGSLKGGVNRGPSGIMSLNGWGSKDSAGNEVGMSGAATSDAETGRNTSNTMAEGASYKDVQDYQAGAVAAGAGQRVNPGFFDSRNTVSPEVLARAKAFAPEAFSKSRSSGIMDFITSGGILGNVIRGVGQKFGLGKKYNEPTYDMSDSNSLGLHADRFPSGTGIPNFESGDGDYDMLGNKINEITGEITSPTGESLGFVPGYPGSDNSGGITTINRGDGGNNYTQNIVETINETVDDNIPNEDLLLRYLGADSTLNPEAAGVNSVAELRDLQMQRAKSLYT